jgi:hypothetical protein
MRRKQRRLTNGARVRSRHDALCRDCLVSSFFFAARA